jgi:hypothetical protein
MTDFASAMAGILNLHARYVDAIWRKDHETVGNCFAEDGEWRIAGEVIRGRAALIEFSKRAQARSRALLITLRPPALRVGDGVAEGRTYFSAHNFLTDGTVFTPIGVYYERFVQDEDGWKFKWRLFQALYEGPADYSGQLIPAPDFGPAPAMPPLDAIPSVGEVGARVLGQEPALTRRIVRSTE